jgi:hypothetical protein
MLMAEKKMTINETEQAILNVLANATEPMTLAEISEQVGKKLVSGNINALLTSKGKVVKGDDKEITYVAKKKVATYKLAD